MHRKILLPSPVRPVLLALLALALSPSASKAYAAVAPTSCDVPLPPTAQYDALFQKDIDATQDFVLQIRHLQPPSGWYVQIGYLALNSAGAPISINPTLLATSGSSMRFTYVNCLGEDEIAWITGYNALDPANTFSPVAGSFNAFPAEEMTPTGYINIHTHGMHGTPTAGTPTVNAGDEVLTTFTSPVSRPFGDNTVSNQQVYVVKVPATQDPGLYWYHPHLHGEAQPQVFLGLTGAIRVLRKHPGDASGAATIAADLAAHANPSAHPSVFVVRDYPVNPFADPGTSVAAGPGAQAPTAGLPAEAPAAASSAAHAHRRVRAHRELYLERTAGGRATTATEAAHVAPPAAPPSSPSAGLNPRCALVDSADASPLCLPDAVSPDPSQPPPPPPSLATLITVNGRQTDIPAGGTPDAPDHLNFQPIAPGTTDRVLRVLNASANTFVKLSLSPAPLTSVDLGTAPTVSVPTVKLTQLRRDGAPVRSADRLVSYILVPPGGRAEFRPATPSNHPLALVSQYFNTGPAGDLVPPRTLVKLPARPRNAAAPQLALAGEEPTPERSERFPNLYTAHSHPTQRALAFFEQDRPCDPSKDCGTTFYLMNITPAVFGTKGGKTPITEAHGFALPMGTLNGNSIPVRDLFDSPNGQFKATVPSIQVNLNNQPEIDEEWDIYNFTGEAHAFHIHQLGFLVSTACSPAYLKAHGHAPDCRNVTTAVGDENHETGLVLDVVNVPPAISVPNADPLKSIVYPAKVHLRVPFTQDIAGNFVMHCHLLEHEDNGMMVGVQVWPNTAPAATTSTSGASTASAMPMH